eukprot:6461826-Amphidinium_carterae.2
MSMPLRKTLNPWDQTSCLGTSCGSCMCDSRLATTIGTNGLTPRTLEQHCHTLNKWGENE